MRRVAVVWGLAVCLVVAWYVGSPDRAGAEPLGAQFQVSDFVWDPPFPNEPAPHDRFFHAAPAFNSQAGQYLAGWNIWDTHAPNKFGFLLRRIDDGGALVGDVVSLRLYPHVDPGTTAYNASAGRYLVVYPQDVNAGKELIGGLHNADLSAAGSWRSDASGSLEDPDVDVSPSVAAAGSGADLIVWQRTTHHNPIGGPSTVDGPRILGQRLNSSGVAVGPTSFSIGSGSDPDVAFGSAGNEWLVVLRSGSDLKGVRLNSAGVAVGSVVAVASGAESAPAVAYAPDRNEYLVVWQGFDPTIGKHQIFGQRLSGSGAKVGSAFEISKNPSFDYINTPPPFDGNEFDPDVAYNSTAKQYLVAWTDTYEVFAQHLTGDGSFIGEKNFRVSVMGPPADPTYHAYSPAIAANESAGQWLTTWDGDNPDHQVWARRIAAPAPAPSVSGISPASTPAGSGALTLTVSGANFTTASKVQWNGSNRSTIYVGSTQLRAAISASDLATPGNASVRVFTPAPGGGTSVAKTFAITSASTSTPPPLNSTLPAISGIAQDGQTVVCSPGSWTNAPTEFAWQWIRSGDEIAGATAASYRITVADVGQAISCRVTASNAGGQSVALSVPIVPVAAPEVPLPPGGGTTPPGTTSSPPTPTAPPVIGRDSVAPTILVALSSRQSLRKLLRSGLRVPVSCSEACTIRLRLLVTTATKRRLHLRSRIIATASRKLTKPGKTTLRLRLNAAARKRLKRTRTLNTKLQTTATDPTGNATTITKKLALRR